MGHEFTHAVIDNTSRLVYQNQPGALNESFADIFGRFVDSDDWNIGENLPGGAIRNMANPPTRGQPDLMANYVMTAVDNGGVHTNSGIHNKAAFLVTDGGTFNGYNIGPGVGGTKARLLFYRTLQRLSNNAQMIDARSAALAVAQDLARTGA